MLLSEIFEKPVDRSIEGVIKADDEASLRLEVEEYVLTNEVAQRLESFLDAYKNYDGANGVWVSGFFGSGKSHLLKILALLLENRSIDGTPVLDLFLPKCADNEILRGDLKRAVEIPSKSILFNIDQKADVISKTQSDALLSVFVKVFDEMCGYYGKHGHIAQFERDLDGRGLYGKFKDAYKNIAKQDWTAGREQALLEGHNIAKAYSQVTDTDEESAKGILDKYRSDYKLSIEDFAEQINTYIEQQEANFRLNFFVDEVGQYVADNTKLMTNLQTVAESLATKCRGRAWVIVTAQEVLDDVVGEMTKKQANDFSKIQARFANRMKLTSANVDEVIQKRLLLKNESGVATLSDVYHEQVNNFKTLFDFGDGSQSYKNFKDRDHFIHAYPFIPYQFTLFQAAIQSLSQHNAFEGKHSSVGERSMLGVFQHVAKHIANHSIRELATFDLMFEGIRTALKAQIQRAVLNSEQHLGDEFAVRVLKALFLVKYVKSFKATVRNISILMLDNFDRNITDLHKQVEAALNLLEQQTYIQRNGELYEFLTNEEKDVEQEVKNTDVENSDVSEELVKLVFDYPLKSRKIRYDDNGQDYAFARKLDDRLCGKDHELTIHIISPFHEQVDNETTLAMQSMAKDELLVIMPADDRFLHDLLLYKKTDKYVRLNMTQTQQEAIGRILTEKSFQNRERYKALQDRAKDLLGKAKLIINLKPLELSSTDPQTRITQGFYDLLRRTYPNLNMLRGIKYSENDIATCLKPSGATLFGGDEKMMSEAEHEMFSFIQGNSRNGVRTTLKSLVERFEKKPYGWYFAAILCITAKLCAREKIEVKSDSNPLEDTALEKALRNSQGHGNIILDPQIDFTTSQVRQLKEFYEDFFDAPPKANEAKPLGKETGAAFKELLQALEPMAGMVSHYPFLTVLKEPISQLRELVGKEYSFYLTALAKLEDNLLDMKDNVLEPVRRFMSGQPKDIYDESKRFLEEQNANFSDLQGDEGQQISDILADKDCFKGNKMQQLKGLVDKLKEQIATLIEEERAKALEMVQTLADRLVGLDEFANLQQEEQQRLQAPFHKIQQELQQHKLIAVIRDRLRSFEEGEYSRLLAEVGRLAHAAKSKNDNGKTKPAATAKSTGGTGDTSEKEPEYVFGRSLKVDFSKPMLVDEKDVEQYLTMMREALLKEIHAGKRIQV
ncbi:MAG: BREX system P-loop protein BrxC [Desulfobulbaceae bacterium]|jgi:polyhydroxyalkanoate synthesis regulator phasin/energy-coupling factor transporter ATP-binding protein EcfA2|nr:BREX system P-loop protein BrxC [Desulfobulbaceae bacterium]